MSPREIVVMAPLVILTLFFGFYPAPVFDVTAASVKKLVKNYEAAKPKASATARLSAPWFEAAQIKTETR